MPYPAYVYGRFSTSEQGRDGRDSLARQFREGRAFVERMGWDYSPARNISDEGLSGFHGLNRGERGALRAFEDRARAGEFKSGVCLCVESIDRFTRRGYEDAIELLQTLTRNGVTVATWFDNQVYEADKRIDLGKVMALIIKAELAHEESSKKSKRLAAAWAAKIERARNGERKALTKIVPGWLTIGDNSGAPVEIANRVYVLNEIYDLYIAGQGLPAIMTRLNDRGEPNWGRGKHSGKGWNVATLHKYLTTRTVLGEYEPKRRLEDGSTKETKGFVIPDYYPQVITAEKYNQAQAVRLQRTGWGGKNQQNVPNLFSGIARCGECGGALNMIAQNKAGSVRHSRNRNGTMRSYTEPGNRSYLRCNAAVRHFGCDNTKSYRYEFLETGILDTLWVHASRGQTFAPDSRVAQLNNQIAEQQRLIDIKRQQLDQMLDSLAMRASQAIADRVADLEKQIERDKDEQRVSERALQMELGAKTPEQDFEELLAARDLLTAEDDELRLEARSKAHRNLRALISRMECMRDGTTFVVIGKNAFAWTFSKEGKCLGGEPGQGVRYEGPDGEPDWHPDEVTA